MRLVIAGGGTGGHVHPALAVLEELQQREIACDVMWIGSASGVEREAAARAGIPYRVISTGKLRRYASVRTLTDAARIPPGIIQAWRHLRAFRPDLVFSTGGFVSVPTVIAAAHQAPILTHEQTTILGLANRINCHFADVLAVSYDQTAARASTIHCQVVVTGNPVRASLLDGDAARGRAAFGFTTELPLVYVTGGARGASPLNQRLAALLPDLLHHCQVLHQTGPNSANHDADDLNRLRATLPAELQARYQVRPFIGDELPDVYQAADIIVGRAGAGTVAEIAFLGKPSILIPLPGTGGDEQTHNAQLLAEAGAAIVLPQAEATPDRLRSTLCALLADSARRQSLATNAQALGRRDAAARLADELLSLHAHSASGHATLATRPGLESRVDPPTT